MHAIILAGGLGTRLRSVVDDRPKVMAPIGGRPFLYYLLRTLHNRGVREVVLCVGYRAEQIEAHFGAGDEVGVRLRYSTETEPLGTAGALRLALPLLGAAEYLVLNGDSFLGADYTPVLDRLRGSGAHAVLALHRTAHAGRYGAVELTADGKVANFVEKGAAHGAPASLINAGVYALRRSVIEAIPSGAPVSLERDVLPGLAQSGALAGVELAGSFIDIGVPDDYRRLERDWRTLFGSQIAE